MVDELRQYNGMQQPQAKKKSLFSKILVVIIALIIIGGLIYIVISVKYPEILEKTNNETAPPTQTPDETEGLSKSAKLIIYILIGGTLLLIGYVVLRSINLKKETDIQKIPVAPDRAEELFIENFSLRYQIECVFVMQKKLYKPANRDAITLISKHPYFHTATGDNFLLMEIEVAEGKRQGIHIVILPIDKGEKQIKEGWYRIDTNTPKHTFMLNRVTYPMSSMADKKDRMQLAMLDRIEDGDKATDLMKQMNTPQNAIGTPLDAYHESDPYTPQNTQRPRQRKPYARRRY